MKWRAGNAGFRFPPAARAGWRSEFLQQSARNRARITNNQAMVGVWGRTHRENGGAGAKAARRLDYASILIYRLANSKQPLLQRSAGAVALFCGHARYCLFSVCGVERPIEYAVQGSSAVFQSNSADRDDDIVVLGHVEPIERRLRLIICFHFDISATSAPSGR